jgi:RNA recognition motif-containing protein
VSSAGELFVKLYVGNISRETTDAQFSELLVPFGKAESVQIAKDRVTGQSRGFGFAEFADPAEAQAAITGLNGKVVNDKALKVNESRPRGQERPR